MARANFRLLSLRLVLPSLGLAAWVAACGSSEGSNFVDGNQNQNGDSGPGTSSGFGSTTSSSGASSSGNPDGGLVGDALRIEPATITVTATGTLKNVKGEQPFKAFVGKGTQEVTATAIWSVDDVGIGTVDASGLFHAASYAGTTKVRAQIGNLTGTAEVKVILKLEEDLTAGSGGGGGISDATKTKLRAGGNADQSSFKWLYPYDKTVFPRGLLPPKLMFGGTTATAYYVRLSAKNIDYAGFYPGGPRVLVNEDWWRTVTKSVGPNDPVTINVTKIEGNNVTGPITETWNIAQGSLKGTVFYNTYNSRIVRDAGGEGAVMRLKPGSNVEVLLGKRTIPNPDDPGKTREVKCIVCHSVSANGNALVAGVDWDGPGGSPIDSALFTIGTTEAPTVRATLSEGRAMPFGALSPDGNWLVGNASRTAPWIRGLGKAEYGSRLYDAKTGKVVDDVFFAAAANRKAVAPSFSPDGKFLAFGDRVRNVDGHALSIVKADLSTSPPSFTDNTKLAENINAVLGWPSFLPDSKAVLYGQGTSYDTGGYNDAPKELVHQCGDLQVVDVATKLTASLDRLNGYVPDGQGGKTCYLPFCNVPDPDSNLADPSRTCNTEDAHMNYEPTVLPVAVGGYYWVVFTSRRAYGNFLSRQNGSVTPTGDLPFDNTIDSSKAIKGWRKKLWVAAIDINGQPGSDPSHPAFLLEGQETEAGNMRGFWALDPCKDNGAGCESGDECCNGFCRQVKGADGGTANACVAPPTGCANDSEKCSVSADCCTSPSGTTCVNGFCTVPTPTDPK